MKNRLRNYGLWISIIALIPMLCEGFGISILPANYEEIALAVLGIVVLLGIVNNPNTVTHSFLDDKE